MENLADIAGIHEISRATEDSLKEHIVNIPDFPVPGINFKDITPLVAQREKFALAIDELCRLLSPLQFDAVVAIESRGFVIGAPIAHKFRVGLIMVRKPGKLPGDKDSFEYTCEYCSGSLEVGKRAIQPHLRYLILDDLLATGGTTKAVSDYVVQAAGTISGFCFLVELTMLHGRALLQQGLVVSLLKY
jgi:adenine phosphoribosyltransferase